MAQLLVVDDDPEIARLLVNLLKVHGFDALHAESGEQALEVTESTPIDLVLLDVRLPGINGFQTCRRMRDAHGPSLPVLMLTAFGDAAAVREALEAGADDFLHKPLDTPALLLKVRASLRLKALHDQIERNREEAQSRARDLALLHEIGRDWSLIAEPEAFNRMVTERLARLIAAPICVVALHDPVSGRFSAALPAYGLTARQARALDRFVKPEYRGLWSFRSGRAYVSNSVRSDPRLVQRAVAKAGLKSVLLAPMLSEGELLGLLVAANKSGGFSESDAQLLSLFAGPAATFVRSRQIFERQRRHAERLEHLAALTGDLASARERGPMLHLIVRRIHRDLGFSRATFFDLDDEGNPVAAAWAGEDRPADFPENPELLRWAIRASAPLQSGLSQIGTELAVPVRAAGRALGLLSVLRLPGAAFAEEEVSLLSTLAGQVAVALGKAASVAQTERLARQMATLYDLGLETSALLDLRPLFVKATEEAGRLIQADHASVLRLDAARGELRLFAVWARDPSSVPHRQPEFRVGEGIAGQVARDGVPELVNDVQAERRFVSRGVPVERMVCVPLTYFDQERESLATFGVLNATRAPGALPFTRDDLEYLMRFAGQLSIAVANSTAFAAERARREQLALVNTLIREIAGNLSRERVLDTAVRRIHEAFGYPVVLIGVAELESDLIHVAAAACAEPAPESWGSYPKGSGAVGRALCEKATVHFPDVRQEPDYVQVVAATRSEVAIPIVSGDEAVAVLNVESDRPHAFSRGEVITLETLADGIGIILRNAELYAALEGTNARLVELDRAKSELVNIVAHDFRSPLAGVLGYAELLEWKPRVGRAERVQGAGAIRQAATHMANLVEKTLMTTRLETGQFAFDFGVVDLGAKLREVVQRLPAESAGVLTAVIPEDPLPCWADGDRIAEVVDNLLSNAVKYSPEGSPIRLEVVRDGETATVRVSDQGVGIAAADLDRLFRPFSRLQRPGQARVPGSGLGLYICERIVRAHGGHLGVDSKSKSGSVFWFSLPLFGVTAQTRLPILLVAGADETTLRDARRAAEAVGYEVHEVSDGVDAVEAASRLLPRAVVLDRVLPHLQADEVAERLANSPATADIPLLVLADETDLDGHERLFRACVPKPLDRDTLAAALRDIIHPAAPERGTA